MQPLNCRFLYFSIFLATSLPGLADNGWEGRILSVTEENDASGGTDRHYTQGASISYLSRDEALPGWLARGSALLPEVGYKCRRTSLASRWGNRSTRPRI